eukprot:895702_1
MYCDLAYNTQPQGLVYDCGEAIQCNFHCDEKQCGQNSVIRGSNAYNLNITQQSEGENCLKDSVIYAPDHGSAYFETHSKEGFKDMTVWSGYNTQNVIIQCGSSHTEDKRDAYCQNMNVYASTSQFVRIDITHNHVFEAAVVECPTNSTYNGPMIARCIIDASDGIMSDITIFAENGIPLDFYVTGCDNACASTLSCGDGYTIHT